MKNNCKCSLRIALTGEGCRYCQPQNYIDILEETIKEITAERDALQAKREALSSDQVREAYRAAFPKGPYVFTNDAVVFARMIENAHGINGIGQS